MITAKKLLPLSLALILMVHIDASWYYPNTAKKIVNHVKKHKNAYLIATGATVIAGLLTLTLIKFYQTRQKTLQMQQETRRMQEETLMMHEETRAERLRTVCMESEHTAGSVLLDEARIADMLVPEHILEQLKQLGRPR